MSDDEVKVVDNPMQSVDDDNDEPGAAAPQKMRALGVDARYNVEKLDLRGIPRAPWVSQSLGHCFSQPGPDPDGNQPAIFVIFPQMVFLSIVLTYSCFTLPVGDACDPDGKKYGEWPSDHYLFYITGWMQCVLMFAPIPLFGVFLGRIGMPMKAGSDRAAQVKACGEDSATFLTAIKITGVTSFVSIMLAVLLARAWTGFPVPFTHLTAGFPGFFAVFAVTVLYLAGSEENFQRLGYKMAQLATLQVCVFFNIGSFSVLSALIKSPSMVDYQLYFALSFTIVKSMSKFIVTYSLKSDFDNALPLLAFLNINAAVFPKVALPSAVSVQTYFTAAFVDVLMTIWGLRILWYPVLKLSQGQKAIDKEQSEADAAAAKVLTLKERLAKANLELKDTQAQAQDTQAALLKKKLAEAESEAADEASDVTDAKQDLEATRSRVDLGRLATEALAVKSDRLEGETDEEFEARTGIDLDGDGDAAGVDNVLLEGAAMKDAQDKEFKVVMTILEQGTDVLIPLLVVATECFLYYGWNGDAVPTLVALTPDEFARSTLLKSISMFIQIATAMFSAFCVNNLCVHFWHDSFCRLDMWTHLSDHLRSTTINFMDVMVYEISRHFWKLVVSAASVLVFCYASLMPVRHHTCSLSIPSCHRSLLQLMGLLSLCVCVCVIAALQLQPSAPRQGDRGELVRHC